MLRNKGFIFALLGGLIVAGIAAGASAGTVRYAGPIELTRWESVSSTDYETIGHYASINAALADIGGGGSLPAGSSSNRYQIRIPPGEFDLGGSHIVMEEWVSIVGSGQNDTILTCACGGGSVNSGAATLVGADNAEVRDLTVTNTGGGSDASVAVYSNGVAPTFAIADVTASASGSTYNYGIYNTSSSPTMTRVTASASGGTYNVGVSNHSGSAPAMIHVIASASGGDSSTNYGALNDASSPDMADVSASAEGGDSSENYGVGNAASSPTMTNVIASASGADNSTNYGAQNDNGSAPTMTRVTASASGGFYNYGVNNNSSSPAMMDVSASASRSSCCGYTYTYGVRNTFSSPTMTNVIASASGGFYNFGVYNESGVPSMTNVTASAESGTHPYGVYNYSSSPAMTNVTVSAEGGTIATGVFNDASSPVMTNVTVTASGGTWSNFGVCNYSSAPTMTNVTASGSGGTYAGYGMANYVAASALTINRSSFSGSDYSIWSDSPHTLNIGATLLDGPIDKSGGTWTCAESYRVNAGVYQAVDSTCAAAGSLLPPAPDSGGGEPAPAEPPALPSPGE